jgi:hypothetical protein
MRKPNPQALTYAFLALSAALSILILAVRNLYDDELTSLYIVTAPLGKILTLSAEGDIHPPGMYLLAHLAWHAIPSFRWMNLFPAVVLYAGLTVFLGQVAPLFTQSGNQAGGQSRPRVCLLLLATLHPQLLMWSTTFRWYSWWTGLALITVTVALQPGGPRRGLTIPRALTLGLLLGALFYLNYITLLFAAALAPAIWFRYRSQPRRALLLRALATLAIFGLVIAPQMHTMIFIHLPASQPQRYGVAFSTLRLLLSLAPSESYLPWHPLAIIAILSFAAICASGVGILMRILRRGRKPASADTRESPLTPILLFGALFFLLAAASGLGGKPRSALLLIPILGVAAAAVFDSPSSALLPRAQNAILALLTLWSAMGIAHLLGRYGLAKFTMNDRPEQVVQFIARAQSGPQTNDTRTTPTCAIVLTHDVTLTFELAQAHIPNLLIVSPYHDSVFAPSSPHPEPACSRPLLYGVESFASGSETRAQALSAQLQIAEQYIAGPHAIHAFSPDPDASVKRRLATFLPAGATRQSVGRMPDFRFVVTSGPIDAASLDAMRPRIRGFLNISGSPIPQDAPPTD